VAGRRRTADDGLLVRHRVLIGDRDRKWSRAVRHRFAEGGIHVGLTPARAPNAKDYASYCTHWSDLGEGCEIVDPKDDGLAI
jgi:hypothetical protein